MNRDQLLAATIDRFEEKFPGGSDPGVAGLYLECFLESVVDTLASGESIYIRDLGTIETASRASRLFTLPGTESRRLSTKSVIRFVPEREPEPEMIFGGQDFQERSEADQKEGIDSAY